MTARIDYQQVFLDLKRHGKTEIANAITPITEPQNWRDFFFFDLDFEKIKQYVYIEIQLIKKILGDEVVRAEHVGSTSIKGMPGTNVPDLVLFIRHFPLSNEQFERLREIGYLFRGLSPHTGFKGNDLFFFKEFEAPLHKNDIRNFGLHFVPENSHEIDFIIRMRDLANTDRRVFQEYYRNKVEKYKNPNVKSFLQYKLEKGKGIFADLSKNEGALKKLNVTREYLEEVNCPKNPRPNPLLKE